MAFLSFGYSVQRPYPYPWFKWVTLIGGICALVFFTALNLAANGYMLKAVHTLDYNGTVHNRQWTQRFPFSILNHAATQCQSHDMSLGTQFWTDKLSLPYTLTNAWHLQNGTAVDNAALTYTNNRLENCTVKYINVNLQPADFAGAQLIAPTLDDPVPAGTGNYAWVPKATVWLPSTIHATER